MKAALRRLHRDERGGGGAMFTLSQTAFWGRNDNGTQATATGKAAQNTNWSQDIDQNFRVRFVMQETAGAAGTTGALQLQYRVGLAGGWSDVTGASSVVRAFDSPNFTDGAATTNHASILGSGTFVAGTMDDVDGAVVSVSLGASTHTEIEYCVQIIGANVANNDLIELRAFATATQVPVITVVKAAVPIEKTLIPAAEAATAAILSFEQGGPQSVSILSVIEGDSAQALSFTKTVFKDIVVATESDTAQAISLAATGAPHEFVFVFV